MHHCWNSFEDVIKSLKIDCFIIRQKKNCCNYQSYSLKMNSEWSAKKRYLNKCFTDSQSCICFLFVYSRLHILKWIKWGKESRMINNSRLKMCSKNKKIWLKMSKTIRKQRWLKKILKILNKNLRAKVDKHWKSWNMQEWWLKH